MKKEKVTLALSVGWLATIVCLFFYSFSQIDLGLTLTRVSFWQVIQKKFQYIGYFNRPLSTAFYLTILLLLFLFYLLILKSVYQKKISSFRLWQVIIFTAFVLWFSYNAFSYDLFNYIFDAKIFTFYRQNPYQHKALDYPGDPMLGFMHWTHRTYPYGPSWLALSIPLSFLGFQKLLPTIILFKALAVLSYLGGGCLIFKILERTNPDQKLIGLTLFAFSPLVVIEGLVSAHNDFLMMVLVLASFWFWLKKKPLFAWLFFFFSAGIKFATGFLIPVTLYLSYCHWQKKEVDWEEIWYASLGLMTIALGLAIKRDELKPWYLLYLWPFLSLLPQKKWLFSLLSVFSFGVLFHYAPFFYLGNWNPPVPTIKMALTIGSLGLGSLISLAFFFKNKSN